MSFSLSRSETPSPDARPQPVRILPQHNRHRDNRAGGPRQARPRRPKPEDETLPDRPEAVIYRALGCVSGQLIWQPGQETAELQLTSSTTVPVALSGAVRAVLERHEAQRDALTGGDHAWRFWPAFRGKKLYLWLLGWEAIAPDQTDLIQVTGFVKGWNDRQRQLQVWVGRNQPTPEEKRKHPAWQIKKLHLQGLPEGISLGWWQFDCRIDERGNLAIAKAEKLQRYVPKPQRSAGGSGPRPVQP